MSFDAEQYLNSLKPIGWRFGLERMNALCDELDRPQDSFGAIHVVGTNGKSSVARMTAALLSAHGLKAGCLVSPHLSKWSERVQVEGRSLDDGQFAETVARAAEAAREVNSGLGPGEVVTQFEIAVAAGFLALADAGVEAAAIEAGLGGRFDATNTIDSEVTVLTSIGLDHTDLLGTTEIEIAAEKLAVLRPGTTLVTGSLPAEVAALARRTAADRDCRVVETRSDLAPQPTLAARGRFQRANFATAVTASEQYLAAIGDFQGGPGGHFTEAELKTAASTVRVPGRLEQIEAEPPLFADVAHNRPGAAALADSIPEIASGRPVVALLAVLSDKDADGILSELAPVVDFAVLSELPAAALGNAGRPGARTWTAAELEEIARRLGITCEVRGDPAQGLELARSVALRDGGVVLVAGSHFLLAALEENWQ